MIDAVGKAAAITRRDSSATLPPIGLEVKFSLRAYAPIRVQRLGRCVSSFLAIALTGKARDVFVIITKCIFGAIWQFEK